ncbi:phage major capsid protein, HK97 family [Chryseobacterium oranimense]|uniref:Phage major capsid protein, HK97 family n=1 Tax=Chryseobacterium oranimense TaxID=421058 RepID=A0A1M5V0X5_9FLAO|nr:phage major capsid protein [Chryseobacterium oranimense]SHH68957.1 phage major capsid protein, HK97 family [Chryseobacterium oranimense]
MTELETKMQEGLEAIKKQVSEFEKSAGENTAKQIKDAIDQKMADLQKQIEDGLKASDNSQEVKDSLEKMQDHLDKLDIKLQKSGASKGIVKTMDEEVKAKFEEKAVQDAIAELKNNRASSVPFEVKAPTTMVLGSYTGNALTTEIDRVISAAPNRMPLFRNIVNVSTIRGNKVTWVNKEAQEGTAGMTAEGAKKSQISWTYTEESADVKKITAFVKVSKEALDDLDFLRSEINTDLREAIEIKLDEQISDGDGVGQNLKGILQYAPSFTVTGTSFATAVFNANRLDVLRTAVALVKKNRFNPNYIVISPMDAALMDLEKGTDGHYILPPFVTADGQRIAGTLVIENEAIEEGSFLVGDFTKSNLRIREEININLGYENDDFTKNLVTILAEMRAVHYIKKHHIPAFLQGTFAAAITAINKPETV